MPCSTAVADYNKNMGGVDKADMLRTLYAVNRKSVKWWHRIFWGLLDIAFVNSYMVYQSMKRKTATPAVQKGGHNGAPNAG